MMVAAVKKMRDDIDDEEAKFRNMGDLDREADRDDEDEDDDREDGEREGECDNGDDDLIDRVIAMHGGSGRLSPAQALEWLRSTTTGREFAAYHRRKQNGDTDMGVAKIVKDFGGIVAVCKNISVAGNCAGLTEADITAEATREAQKLYPKMRPDSAFAKFAGQHPEIFRACEVAKTAGWLSVMPKLRANTDGEYKAAMAKQLEVITPMRISFTPTQTHTGDPVEMEREALAQLQALGQQRWPNLTREQQFARAFSAPENRELAARAHRPPTGHPSYVGHPDQASVDRARGY